MVWPSVQSRVDYPAGRWGVAVARFIPGNANGLFVGSNTIAVIEFGKNVRAITASTIRRSEATVAWG